ncbi:MAG: hypothetical protein QM706_13925 [Nitrospira sp.]
MTVQAGRPSLLNGWLISITLHGLLLVSLLPLFRQSMTILPKEPFHWDVTLVQSAPTDHSPVQTADIAKSDVQQLADRSSPIAPTPQTIQRAVSSTKPIAHHKPQAVTAVAPTAIPDNPSPVTSASEIATTSTPTELSSTHAQTTEPLSQQIETPLGSPTPAPPRLETAAPAALEQSTPADSTLSPPPPSAASDINAGSTIRLDYGWLQQAIFRRLEELKRTSRPSLDQSQPFKVTVKAVVSRDGILLDSSVANSSGLDHIDQEALALVQRAFPLQLDRSLDRQQIVMRIPITYSHE